ncbi:MAG: hypothetical protein J0L75_14145 [Spirochaetes bacterium]|nr:hypothetical protein [Spirochaetota bacterium]
MKIHVTGALKTAFTTALLVFSGLFGQILDEPFTNAWRWHTNLLIFLKNWDSRSSHTELLRV